MAKKGFEKKWFNNQYLLMINFVIMMTCFAVNHGTVSSVLALASQPKVLGTDLGGYSSGALYVAYTLSSLTVTSFVVEITGGKYGLASGLGLYCFYVGSFLVAVKIPSIKWYATIGGSVIGGIGAGWLWTAQGVYFTNTAKYLAKIRGSDISVATSWLAGLFATFYVGFELICKFGSSVLVRWGGEDLVFIVFTIMAVASVVLLVLFTREFPKETKEPPNSFSLTKKLTMAMRLLYTNRKLLYLAPFELTFGFIAAYINNYVNGIPLRNAIGEDNIGYMASVIPGVATLLSLPYSKLANLVGKKWLMIFAIFNWIAIAASLAIPSTRQVEGLGWGIIYIYILAGSGRAVFEATNRATFADFFPNDKEAAFSNLVVLSGGSAALGFFLFPQLTATYTLRWIMASTTIISGLLGFIGLLIAFQLNEKEKLFKAYENLPTTAQD